MKSRFFLFLLLGSLVVVNSCQKEYSFEGGAGPSEGTLQDDGSGDCLPKTVAGTYVMGLALDPAANYIEVTVDVTVAGSYAIYTDTVNGISFKGTGFFTATGPNTVKLKGSGTPIGAGIHNFIVSYGTSGCSIAVTTSGTLATFTLGGAPGTCTGATPVGTYQKDIPLTAANTVNITVNVTALGSFSINTGPVNGMTFTASGAFTTLGSQSVVLVGTGTPSTVGPTTVPVVAGTSSCSFIVDVQPATAAAVFTVDCAAAVVNGTYIVGTVLSATTNTISLPVTVTTAGNYTISATLNGMTFSASGTFATATQQTVTLAGNGTPTTAGPNAVPVTGGTAGCNITVNVNPAAGGAATFTVDCSSATPNGTYTEGVALTATNTITITVNATVAGTYTITTTAINGMTFSSSGTLVLGANTVTLTPTAGSTPTADGTFTIQITSGTTPCSFDLDVDPATASIGNWTFKEGTNTFSGTFSEAEFDNTLLPPYNIFFMIGETAAGHYFELDIADVSGTVANGETYNCAATTAVNFGGFFFDGPPPASPILYEADPTITPNSLVITVTTHNTVTKTISGTFAGNVLDGNGAPKAITQGVFTITYP